MSAASAANPFADEAQSGSSIDHSGNPFADEQGATGAKAPETTLDNVANAPNTIPLDSYTHATERGIANIGQGAAQAVQAAGHMIFHSDQASKELIEGVKKLPSQAAALVKDPPSLQDIGDTAGTTAGNLMAGEVLGEGARGVAKAAGKTAGAAAEYAKTRTTPVETKIAAPIKATVPEAAMQPDKAVAATDRLVRATAPTATDVRARANFHAAAGDLAQVADKVEWDKVRGGKGLTEGSTAPDMRPRAVLHAVNERMGEMYKAEVEPKIQAMEGVPAKLNANPEAYKFLATTAGDETIRNLAHKAAANPGSISVPEAYQLSRAVNAELVKFESLPADQQYLARTTNPAINKLDGLDESLNQTISQAFKDRGIGGIDNFNRRYAAMASVRRGLNIRVNAAELQRQGTLARAGKVVRAVTGKNVNAVASASQASLSDVNIGDQLERGLKDLKKSGIKPNVDQTPGAPNLALKSPGGKLPPDAQRPLSFMDSPSPDRSGPVYPGGKGNLSKALTDGTSASSSAKPTEPVSGTAEKTSSLSSSNNFSTKSAGNPFDTVETDRSAQARAKAELGSATHPDFLKRAQEIKQDLLENKQGGQIVEGAPNRFLKILGADEGSVIKTPEDEATVKHFQQKIKNGENFEEPTLTVDKSKSVISGDGRHRLLAHQREGTQTVKVRVNRTGEEGVKTGVIGQRLAKPRTPNSPLEHGFDFRPAEDLGNAAREASQKKQGPIARGERRVVARTAEEQRTQQLFAEARKELGDDATSEEIMAKVEQKKSQTAKPGMMRALTKKKGA
jgi:hypothetical protein